MQLGLTPQELDIFTIIRGIACQHGVVLRAFGGWVRDKIMNTNSYDIDIAVYGMTVPLFTTILQEQSQQFQSAQINLEKSRFGQVVTTKIGTYQIDFIQYSNPDQDANNRDLTINSVFYNIITCQIEDFTSRGINDIIQRMIDTPQSPFITISMEPLRILRILRFSQRFQFQISSHITNALSDQDLVKKIQTVNRSLISKEIFKILTSVFLGMETLCKFPLVFHEIFIRIFWVCSPKFRELGMTAECWIQSIQVNSLLWLSSESDVDLGINRAKQIFFTITMINFNSQNIKPMLAFLIISAPFKDQIFNVESDKLSWMSNQKARIINEPMQYLIPFIACALGSRFGQIIKQVYGVIVVFRNFQQKIDIQIEQGIETTIEERRVISRLFSLENEALFLIFILDSIQNSPFFHIFTRLFRFYNEGEQILKYKPQTNDLQEIATRCNILDRRFLSLFKEYVTVFQLSYPSYPDLDDDWEDCFVNLYLKNKIIKFQ